MCPTIHIPENIDPLESSGNFVFTPTARGNKTTAHSERIEAFKQKYGHDPYDTEGGEFDEQAQRVCAVLFLLCGGCCCILLDKIYSDITGSPRTTGDKRNRRGGTNYLRSMAVCSQLETDNPRSDDDNCEGFLRRYYGNCEIFNSDIRGKALESELVKLKKQLYTDISHRRYRKTKGDYVVLWGGTLLAAFVAIVAFLRNIMHTQNSDQKVIRITNYIEGAASLFVLLLTQITNRKTQSDAVAAKNLEKIRQWAKDYVKARLEQEGQASAGASNPSPAFFPQGRGPAPHRPKTMLPIEDALSDLLYHIIPVQSISRLEASTLYQAVATHLTRLGKNTTEAQVRDAIEAFLLTDKVDTSGTDSLISNISRLYDCPIFLVSEQAFPNETYCKLINEMPPEGTSRAAESEDESKEDHQAYREKCAMAFYMPKENIYHLIDTHLPGQLLRPFETMKQELTEIKPHARPPRSISLDQGHPASTV